MPPSERKKAREKEETVGSDDNSGDAQGRTPPHCLPTHSHRSVLMWGFGAPGQYVCVVHTMMGERGGRTCLPER